MILLCTNQDLQETGKSSPAGLSSPTTNPTHHFHPFCGWRLKTQDKQIKGTRTRGNNTTKSHITIGKKTTTILNKMPKRLIYEEGKSPFNGQHLLTNQ